MKMYAIISPHKILSLHQKRCDKMSMSVLNVKKTKENQPESIYYAKFLSKPKYSKERRGDDESVKACIALKSVCTKKERTRRKKS